MPGVGLQSSAPCGALPRQERHFSADLPFAVNLDELGDHLRPKGGRSFTFRVMLGRRWRAARWGQPLGGYTPPLTPGVIAAPGAASLGGDARGVVHPGHAAYV